MMFLKRKKDRQARKEWIRQMAESVPFWWHSIDLGEGITTRGFKTSDILNAEFQALTLPDLKRKTVLDIGAWDGFFSFEVERLGASRVLALDHYAWSLDLAAQVRYIQECKEKGVAPQPYHTLPELWHPHELPGKQGFDTAHKTLGSHVESLVADFMDMDLDDIGVFDVVLYLGVLYHIENPFEALKRVAKVTRELAIIETVAVVVPGFEHNAICEFFESNELDGDISNWWAPNLKALQSMCRAAGFRRIETMVGPPDEASLPKQEVSRYRATIQAWK